MIRTALIFGLALALQAQELTPEQQAKLEAAKKKLDETVTAFALSSDGGTFQFVTGQMLNGKPVKGQPYSAEAVNETVQTLPDGNRIVNRNSSMLYRDSEGRERREESFGKLGNWNAERQPAKAIFISDPVAKLSYTLQEKSHTATKMPMVIENGHRSVQVFSYSRTTTPVGAGVGAGIGSGSGEDRVVRIEPTSGTASGSNAKTEKLGTQTIEGVIAEGTRTTITIPAGKVGNERDIQIVDERWYSPELQVTIMSRHSDPRMGETTYKLTNVNRAEPPRSLFEVPADYSITEPELRVRRPLKDDNQF